MAESKQKNQLGYIFFLNLLFITLIVFHFLYLDIRLGTYPLAYLPPFISLLNNNRFLLALLLTLSSIYFLLLKKLPTKKNPNSSIFVLLSFLFLPVICYDLATLQASAIIESSIITFPWWVNTLAFIILESAKLLILGIVIKMLLLKPLVSTIKK